MRAACCWKFCLHQWITGEEDVGDSGEPGKLNVGAVTEDVEDVSEGLWV